MSSSHGRFYMNSRTQPSSSHVLSSILVAALLCFTVSNMCGTNDTFVPSNGAKHNTADELNRRIVLMGTLPALLGAEEAQAVMRVTDRTVYVNRRKIEIVPGIKQGWDYLNRKGVDKRMLLFLPRMCRKMEIYANVFSLTEAPDKTVRKLVKDTKAFKKAVEEDQDREKALKLFDVYLEDIPGGPGKFDPRDESSYSMPPAPDEDRPFAFQKGADFEDEDEDPKANFQRR